MISYIFKNRYLITYFLFFLYTLFWLYIQSFFPNSPKLFIDIFSNTYCLMALIGGLFGVFIAKKWGGWKSLIGKTILLFSFGLFAQTFGQITYSYMSDILKIDIPYPSIGDLGYFGSVIMYIYGSLLLAKAIGIKFTLNSIKTKLQAITVPLLLLGYTYFIFLKDYKFNYNQPLTILLDFGYPLGQSFYISIILLTFLLTRKILGGLMRKKILFLYFALLLQYLSDFNFLYQNNRGTWVYAGYGDYLYFLAYFFMTLAILNINNAYHEIYNS